MESTIQIKVSLDGKRMPEAIRWSASDSTADSERDARAMILSFWDGAEKSALRIDLWTREMMIDEMTDFYYQTLMSLADTYERATRQSELAAEMKNFARDFYRKFQEAQTRQAP